MSVGFLSYALLAALATGLVIAAMTDLRRREIDNGLNAAIALAAPLWWLSLGFGLGDVGFQLALAAGTFVVACLLFATGQMGGGDVKLIAALALWFPPAPFAQLIVLMAILGGGASVAMAAFNMERLPGEKVRDALSAIFALGWIWCAGAIVVAAATHGSVMGPGTVATFRTVLPNGWSVALAVLAAVLIFYLGFTHMMRRQKSRLPIPYGIAISAAGLWVMGDRVLQMAHIAAQTG